MEHNPKKSKSNPEEDEKQFTDLLFGDLEDLTPKETKKEEVKETKERVALWHDSDDDEVEVSLVDKNRKRKLRTDFDEKSVSGAEYSKRLRKHISATNEADDLFALRDKTDANDDVATLLRTTKRFIGSTKALPSEHLDIQKLSEFALKDDNTNTTGKGRYADAIRYVSFHRSEPMFLVSGQNSCVHLYTIKDSEPVCRKMVHFSHFYVHQVDWTSRNTLLMTSKNREFLMYYDVERDSFSRIFNVPGYQELKHGSMCVSPSGDQCLLIGSKGTLFNVDLRTRRTTNARQLASPVRHASFYDNETCYLITEDNMIAEYDMRTNSVRQNYWDADMFGSRVIKVCGNYTCVGDASGICTLYDTPTVYNTQESTESYRSIKPLKVFKNLVTEINCVDINNDNSMMVYASGEKFDQIRAVHIPSLTVFSNWPEKNERFHLISSLSISGDNQYMVLGNKIGKVYLYRFNHFYH